MNTILKKITGNKKAFAALACLAVLLLVTPSFANAQVVAGAGGAAIGAGIGTAILPGIGTVAGGLVGAGAGVVADYVAGGIITSILASTIAWVLFVVSYVISIIGGVAISIIAYFVEILLQVNTGIVNSILVQKGFGISLAVTNLFFVLGIIVIAIATILRNQSYGMKQVLWKLVVMAILINFGLVLVAPILGFSDQLTKYFLDAFVPSGNQSSYNGFATSLAGAFTPQRVLLNLESGTGNALQNLSPTSVEGLTKNGFADILKSILNVIFPVFFIIFIAITMGSFVIMLLIRYVYIGYLLVLLPFAWLAWVFPIFKSTWTKWWTKFIHWTMFAPIVVFFLYLAIITAGAMATKGQPGNPLAKAEGTFQQNNQIVQGAVAAAGPRFDGIIATILQMAIVLAISIGGLIMANSMGITFADHAVKGITNVSKGFGGWVGRRSRQYAGRPLRSAAGQKITEGIQNWAGNRKTAAGRYVAGWMARGTTRLSTLAGEDTVKREEGIVAGIKNTRDLLAALPTANEPQRIAIRKELAKRSALEGVDNPEAILGKDAQGSFEKYHQKKEYDDIQKKVGVSAEMWAFRNDVRKLQEAANKFYAGVGKTDANSMQVNDLFSRLEENQKKFGFNKDMLTRMQQVVGTAIAQNQSPIVSTILSKVKGASFGNFQSAYRNGIASTTLSADERKNLREEFDKLIMNNTYFGAASPETTPGTTATPPPPPPPPSTP